MLLLFHLGLVTSLVIAAILIAAWYGLLVPGLCKKQPAAPFTDRRSQTAGSAAADEPEDLMGKPALPAGVSEVAAHELQFRQRGLVPDALQELKSIFHILETEQGTKQDFMQLFRLVSSKYRQLVGTPSQTALNDYIRENALFPISDTELATLWN